jgi:two-component system, cell cycle response regulator CpdR
MARILIAEDESMLCDMCARTLVDDGHEVETVHDGTEALDALNKHSGQFDLLLTDVRMPKMDGIALSMAAAREFPDLTILLMTGYADQRERAQVLDPLVHDVLAKPFSVASLRGAVNEALAVRARG